MAERVWVLLAAATLVVAACGGPPAPLATTSATPTATATASPTPSPSPPPATSGSLGEALALVGPIPQAVYFTDWAAIRASVGAEELTGSSPFEDKARAIRNESTFAGFGLAELRTQATDWGFDAFDLDWEAQVSGSLASVWFLRLRDGFDVARFTAKLDGYGFATEQLAHGVLRKGTSANLRQGDRLLTNILLLNTGILDDGRTLVLSAIADPEHGDPVREVLSNGPQPVVDMSVQSVAGLLERPLAAAILVGDRCRDIQQDVVSRAEELRGEVDQLLAEAGPLGHYNVLAVSYSRTDGVTTGRIVMGYPDEGQAEADLEGRRSLAANGISVLSSYTTALIHYADRSFVLVNARVAERSIVLEVGPPTIATPTPNPSAIGLVTDFLPRGLVGLVARRDLLFATCSP